MSFSSFRKHILSLIIAPFSAGFPDSTFSWVHRKYPKLTEIVWSIYQIMFLSRNNIFHHLIAKPLITFRVRFSSQVSSNALIINQNKSIWGGCLWCSLFGKWTLELKKKYLISISILSTMLNSEIFHHNYCLSQL
jgi:hypothetical protein